MANEFIARKGLIVLSNGAKITGSFSVSSDSIFNGPVTASTGATGSFTGSFRGDGSQLTGLVTDLRITGSTGTDTVSLLTDSLSLLGSNGVTTVVTNNTVTIGIPTGTVSASSQVDHNATTNYVANQHIDHSTVSITAGSGLSGGGDITATRTLTLDTSSAHFTGGVKSKLNTDGVFSSSIQTDVRQTTGIATIATTGSNTFTADQIISGNIALGSNGQIRIPSNTANTLFGFFDGSNILGAYYQMWGGNAAGSSQQIGSAEFVYDNRNNADANFHVASFNGTTWTQKFIVNDGGVQVTGSLKVTEGITGSLLSTNGVVSSSAQVTALLPTGTVSSSGQVDVRNTTGIATIATTGSNTFTGIQTISNTTNSTNYTDGALIVQGGVGIAKDVYISGSLNVDGLLTAVSMSTQYVTSSQYTVGVSRIILNDDDLVRFSGISVVDSGSTYGTGSLLWDSLNNRWIYEADDVAYNSAIIIAGPKNTGSLGSEVGLITGRIPVAAGDDHIDTNPSLTPLRVEGTTLHAEGNVYVTGSVTASAFSGDGSNLTGIVTNLNITGSDGGTGTVSLKTQALTVDGTNGLTATVSGQTITISGSDATTTTKGVAAFNSANFSVVGGQVTASAITFNSVPLNLGSAYSFGLANITSQGATWWSSYPRSTLYFW
jgi:trimeric autotransporter adhesin